MFLLLSEPAAEVAARFRLREERARVMPAGAAIVGALFERYGVERIRVSNASIREGAILAAIHAGPTWRTHLEWLAHGWSRGLPAPPSTRASEAGENPSQPAPERDPGD
jgi:exopolyphosphatase/pppGpp-phosphohydrolase